MTATDTLHVVYPVPDEQLDDELRKLTEQHPGIAARVAPLLKDAAKQGGRAGHSARRSLARGWARVRGCAGSLAGMGSVVGAVYTGWGLVPGLIATGVALIVGEKLLEDPKAAS